MNRDKLRKQAEETLNILSVGCYEIGPEIYSIEEAQKLAFTNSVLVREFQMTQGPLPKVEVVTCSTLEAATPGSMILNFASGTRRGGGWLSGANAQEESLVRSSGLFPCLMAHSEFYEGSAPFYTDNIIYSPGVPVFRSSSGSLTAPYLASFATCAAPNASSGHTKEMEEIMSRRIANVLCLASKYEKVILGAWGCGAFKNPPAAVARLFKKHLDRGIYSGHAIFAIIDEETASIFRNILKP